MKELQAGGREARHQWARNTAQVHLAGGFGAWHIQAQQARSSLDPGLQAGQHEDVAPVHRGAVAEGCMRAGLQACSSDSSGFTPYSLPSTAARLPAAAMETPPLAACKSCTSATSMLGQPTAAQVGSLGGPRKERRTAPTTGRSLSRGARVRRRVPRTTMFFTPICGTGILPDEYPHTFPGNAPGTQAAHLQQA